MAEKIGNSPFEDPASPVWETLYEKAAADIRRLAYKRSKDPAQDEEDIVQDTFLKAWQKRGMLDPKKNVCGFLATTARRRILDINRHMAIVPTPSFEEMAEVDQEEVSHMSHGTVYNDNLLLLVAPENTEATVLERETTAEIVDGIMQLPPGQQAVSFARLAGETVIDFATRTGTPQGTAKGADYRARERLRILLPEALAG